MATAGQKVQGAGTGAACRDYGGLLAEDGGWARRQDVRRDEHDGWGTHGRPAARA